jgi:S1-C subfamily serine protease
VKRPWLGASLQNITPDIAESIGLDRPVGALVAAVTPGSPAAAAGLKTGDVISSIDGQPVDEAASMGFRLATKALGGEAAVGVRRGRQTLTIALGLTAAPETPPREPLKIASRSPFSGALIWNLSPAVLDEMSMTAPDQGVVIADIAAGSLAANLGLRRGDVVEEVNGKKIATTRDLERATADRAQYWDLAILRDGQVIRTEIGG